MTPEMEQFRAVFFEAADAMLILDDRRAILEANNAACSLFGVKGETIAHLSLEDLVNDPVETIGATWRELMALGEAKREHRVGGGSSLRLIECNYRARVHRDRHLCVARDITDRRRLEERVAQSEKIESVGRLAGGIAHDFNNLLTAILGYTEMLLNSRQRGDPDRADLEEIQRAGKRAAALTQQLLAYSRKQVLMPKEVDLNATVTGLQGMLTRLIREDINLTCTLAPAPAIVRIDPVQLEQVILNLVLNARDALPTGGNVWLEVARMPWSSVEPVQDHPRLSAVAGQCVRLRVIDDGVGIAPEVRVHLFEPFFTTKAIGKGTGLGLASVYGIVQQSNGFISVESEPGKGTTFTMYFPAVQETGGNDAASGPSPAAAEGRETILVVEDEDAVRSIVVAVLRRRGYYVVEAATPSAALDLFDEHPEIALMVSDVVMPEMSGPALAQRLIGRRKDLRVLFISGYAQTAILPDGDNPNTSFLSKPFPASVLTARVRELLSRRRLVQV